MLIKDGESKVFDEEEVKRGTLISAKHSSWDESIAGMVSQVHERYIVVNFLPSKLNVMNHYFIHMSELLKGEWDIRYSNDGMTTINEYPPQQHMKGESDGSE